MIKEGKCEMRTSLRFIQDISLGIEKVAFHSEAFLLAVLRRECCCCFASKYCILSSANYILASNIKSRHRFEIPLLHISLHHHKQDRKLTFKTTLHLHNLLAPRTLNHIRRMNMKMLLDYAAQVITLHIEHLLAASQAHDFAFDFEHGGAVCEFDAEAVAAEGHDFFFQHERFGACGEKLREYADGLGGWCEGHGCVGVWGLQGWWW